MNSRLCALFVALAVCVLAGCPQSTEAPATGTSPQGGNLSEAGYKRRAVGDLPEVEDHLPPLDEGRVEVAGPVEWRPLPRSSKSLASFVKGKASELPRIAVTVGEPPAGDLGDTTEDNVELLVAALDAQLRRDAAKEVPEPCLPIVLGDRVFVRHVRLAKMTGDPVVIQSLQTIAGGRLYTVELICYVNAPDRRQYETSLKEHRDYGYAVAANMRFGGAADPLAAVSAVKSSETPAKTQAEKPPEKAAADPSPPSKDEP